MALDMCLSKPVHPNHIKRGFTVVYIILISAQKHRLWVFVRTASIYVLSRNKKNIGIFICKFTVFSDKIFNIFE